MRDDLDNKHWERMLREQVQQRTSVRRNIKLPNEHDFEVLGNKDHLKIKLSEDSVLGNMQEDRSAVEGWAAILFGWCDVERVTVSWERPSTDKRKKKEVHYQRFLYRMRRFSELFTGRVIVADHGSFDGCEFERAERPLLGGPGRRLPPDVPADPHASESAMEIYLSSDTSARDALRRIYQLGAVDRQLPVGVFKDQPSTESRIFSGGKSAIDLIALGSDGSLWIFELKKAKNIKVGALSELFFYSMVTLDVQRDRISLANNWSTSAKGKYPFRLSGAEISGARGLHARILAPDFHPLLSQGVYKLFNDQAQARGWAVDYGACQLGPSLQPLAVAA
jgi:hypothetical protein